MTGLVSEEGRTEYHDPSDTSSPTPTFLSTDIIIDGDLSISGDISITGDIFYFGSPNDRAITKKFGLPLEEKRECPVCGEEGSIANIIAHLNNKVGKTMNIFDLKHGTHNWTFKQIGLWLKEIGY